MTESNCMKILPLLSTSRSEPFQAHDLNGQSLHQSVTAMRKEARMVKSLIMTVGLLMALGSVGVVLSPEQAIGSTFTKVSVQAVDTSAQSLTFRTTEGQTWTLTAASPDLLKDLHAGDICSLEIDSDDRVVKIVRASTP